MKRLFIGGLLHSQVMDIGRHEYRICVAVVDSQVPLGEEPVYTTHQYFLKDYWQGVPFTVVTVFLWEYAETPSTRAMSGVLDLYWTTTE
jgi:hypothetical protein